MYGNHTPCGRVAKRKTPRADGGSRVQNTTTGTICVRNVPVVLGVKNGVNYTAIDTNRPCYPAQVNDNEHYIHITHHIYHP